MKSAYERALEKLEEQGIERPREGSLTDDDRQRIAEIRSRAEAKLAELEILHRDRLKGQAQGPARETEEADYRAERERIESRRDREIAQIRDSQ